MRKVVIPKLSQEEKDGIRDWLKLYRKRITCPFVSVYGYGDMRKCEICYKMFPRLFKDRPDHVGVCPCAEYKLDTVVERAKEALK